MAEQRRTVTEIIEEMRRELREGNDPEAALFAPYMAKKVKAKPVKKKTKKKKKKPVKKAKRKTKAKKKAKKRPKTRKGSKTKKRRP